MVPPACSWNTDLRVLNCSTTETTWRGSVERGKRPAQHLDAARRAEPEIGRLPLPVGHARGNTVGVHPDAAHPEGRARAEAARLDLQVLRIVLPVLHRDARDAPQA